MAQVQTLVIEGRSKIYKLSLALRDDELDASEHLWLRLIFVKRAGYIFPLHNDQNFVPIVCLDNVRNKVLQRHPMFSNNRLLPVNQLSGCLALVCYLRTYQFWYISRKASGTSWSRS